ncbi:ABC transporter ATP-binding protein [Ectobacillus panaciterrae]|uniref:ABC transporter ATP-binding protein n=1 Tax=Ectobacillus panaciterrae TaxID=363872 RepID=UPI000416D028|nr:ABC transporter ATP-binding protein [Ectobacillus panaciterrae]
MFTLQNVSYKDILHIPELTIQEGKVTCIIGESGSGKTTLLKMLNDMHSPDSGTVLYRGEPISSYSPIQLRREVVMLGQTPPIFEGTVKENLLMGLYFSEKSAANEKELHRALQTVHLEKSLEDNAEQLSGGEKQRLALARVLLMDPAVFLLDEPTSALDENTAHIVMTQFIKEAKDKKNTVIMITHSRTLAEEAADDMVEISKEHGAVRKEVSR